MKVCFSIFRLLIDDITVKLFQISAGLDLIPSTPPPRVSPSRSEPPGLTTDKPAPSERSRSESHDEFSDSDDEEGERFCDGFLGVVGRVVHITPFFFISGVGRQRATVIRRFRSEDSVQAFSVESVSNTPADIVRQRSLSSVAIFDDNEKGVSEGREFHILVATKERSTSVLFSFVFSSSFPVLSLVDQQNK